MREMTVSPFGPTHKILAHHFRPQRRRIVGHSIASRGFRLKPSGMLFVGRHGRLSGVGVPPTMGQDDTPVFVTSLDTPAPAAPAAPAAYPTFVTSLDQPGLPASQPVPGIVTSLPAASPAPSLTLPAAVTAVSKVTAAVLPAFQPKPAPRPMAAPARAQAGNPLSLQINPTMLLLFGLAFILLDRK